MASDIVKTEISDQQTTKKCAKIKPGLEFCAKSGYHRKLPPRANFKGFYCYGSTPTVHLGAVQWLEFENKMSSWRMCVCKSFVCRLFPLTYMWTNVGENTMIFHLNFFSTHTQQTAIFKSHIIIMPKKKQPEKEIFILFFANNRETASQSKHKLVGQAHFSAWVHVFATSTESSHYY